MKIKSLCPGRIYRNIAKEQKVNYWMTFSNIILICITFWFGLYVQDIIAKKNADASSVLANAEYTAKVKPIIDSLNIKYGPILLDIVEIVVKKNEDSSAPFSFPDSMVNRSYNDLYSDVLYAYYSAISAGCSPPKKEDTVAISVFALPYLATISDCAEFFHSSIMKENPNLKWEDGWQYVNNRIGKMLRSLKYIEKNGLDMTYYIDSTLQQAMKETYLGLNENGNIEEGIIILKSKAMRNAMTIFGWLNDNKTFKTSENMTWKTIIKEIFTGELVKVLVFVLFIGFCIAFLISLALPKEREQNETEKQLIEISKTLKSITTDKMTADVKVVQMPEPFDDMCIQNYKELYNSEHEYASKLMNILIENDIKIPPKEE
ncbi:MAG: hypothetical protein IJ213_04460 [Bacteroidales bacterium]|nr:hypothetical protein [Bacteroidales bacterium]